MTVGVRGDPPPEPTARLAVGDEVKRIFGVVILGGVVLASVACTETAGVSPFESPSSTKSAVCERADRVLAGTSPFEKALARWAREPIGSRGALEELDAACDASADGPSRGTEEASCFLLGLVHAAGEGVPRDPRRAFSYFARSAKCGILFGGLDIPNAEHQRIGSRFVACCGGRSCEPGCESQCAAAIDAIKAAVAPPLAAACDQGRATACYLIGEDYIDRLGSIQLARGKNGAPDLKDYACDHGLGLACWDKDVEDWSAVTKPLPRETRACDLGWGEACLRIGERFDAQGKRGEAVKWWDKACKNGLDRVCSDLSTMYSKGDGVPVDHDRASDYEAETWRSAIARATSGAPGTRGTSR